MSRLIKSTWANERQSNEKVISIKNLESFDNNDYASQPEYQKTIEKANEEAALIRQQTYEQIEKEKAELLMEKKGWEAEKEQLREEAKAVGYNDGVHEGRNTGYEEFKKHIQLAQEVIECSKNDYQSYMQSAENTILQLSIKIAEKIINSSISADNRYFLTVVKKVLNEALEQKEIQLHVHPNQFEYVMSEKEELLSLFPIQPKLFIFPNETISENGCVIETANGRIDANIDTQLMLIKQKLLDLLESE
ncbi:MAG: flagellar assembly protein FliH [Bacillus sp. (in: firmicutes)]